VVPNALAPGETKITQNERPNHMSEFHYIDVVKLGINAANARVPRLQKSAINEFGDMLSLMVTAGEFVIDGDDALTAEGQNVEQLLDHLISTRPHWEVPATVVDAADVTWTSGDLTLQGKRWKELRAFLGSDAATNAAMAAEAELYGARPGSTKKGVRPGDVLPKAVDHANALSPSNPWNPKSKYTPQEALAEQTRLLKALGTPACVSMAAACGVSVFGVPLKK
jgi:hypothetical protein